MASLSTDVRPEHIDPPAGALDHDAHADLPETAEHRLRQRPLISATRRPAKTLAASPAFNARNSRTAGGSRRRPATVPRTLVRHLPRVVPELNVGMTMLRLATGDQGLGCRDLVQGGIGSPPADD